MGMENEKKARKAIHKCAIIGATSAGTLPVGADALALASEEALLVVYIAAQFGHPISKDTAVQALTTGLLGTAVGTAAATALFEGLNLAYPATIPAKIAVATGVMETLGWTTYEFYKNGHRITT